MSLRVVERCHTLNINPVHAYINRYSHFCVRKRGNNFVIAIRTETVQVAPKRERERRRINKILDRSLLAGDINFDNTPTKLTIGLPRDSTTGWDITAISASALSKSLAGTVFSGRTPAAAAVVSTRARARLLARARARSISGVGLDWAN